MAKYYGDFLAGKTVRVRFNTINPATGAPASLASGTVTISRDGTDVTPSGGVTLAADVGSVVGRNHVIIDMSADPTTFAAGGEYAARLSGTSNVGGTSQVGIVVGEWSVANRSVAVDSAGRVNAGSLRDVALTAASAGNFQVFFHDAGGTTTRIVDNVGSGAGSFPSAAPSNWLTASAFAAGVLPTNFSNLAIETTTGRVDVGSLRGVALTAASAGNFQVFYHDAGATTTKVVDNVGTGSGSGSFPATAPANWLTISSFANRPPDLRGRRHALRGRLDPGWRTEGCSPIPGSPAPSRSCGEASRSPPRSAAARGRRWRRRAGNCSRSPRSFARSTRACSATRSRSSWMPGR
jgi:hypothetical protein